MKPLLLSNLTSNNLSVRVDLTPDLTVLLPRRALLIEPCLDEQSRIRFEIHDDCVIVPGKILQELNPFIRPLPLTHTTSRSKNVLQGDPKGPNEDWVPEDPQVVVSNRMSRSLDVQIEITGNHTSVEPFGEVLIQPDAADPMDLELALRPEGPVITGGGYIEFIWPDSL